MPGEKGSPDRTRKTIEGYIGKLPKGQQRLVTALIGLVRKGAPAARLSIK